MKKLVSVCVLYERNSIAHLGNSSSMLFIVVQVLPFNQSETFSELTKCTAVLQSAKMIIQRTWLSVEVHQCVGVTWLPAWMPGPLLGGQTSHSGRPAAPALSRQLSWSTDLTAQISGWTHRSRLRSRAHDSPRQGDITRLEIRAVTLQSEIHLDLKCLNAPEVQEFIHPSIHVEDNEILST